MSSPFDPNNPDDNSTPSSYGSAGGYQPGNHSADQAYPGQSGPSTGGTDGYSYGDYSGGGYGSAPQGGNQPGASGGYPNYQAQGGNQQDLKAAGKGFFGALFDFNFDSFISVKFAKFIYILVTVVAALYVLAFWVLPFLGMLFSEGQGSAIGAIAWLLFGWIPVGIVTLMMLISTRMFLEFVIATIKTAENTSKLANGNDGWGR